MATIELTENSLIVRVGGVDKFFSFKSQLEVPLSHVVGAEVDPLVVQEWGNWWKGVRIPGAHVPGLLAAGNFYQNGERVFWFLVLCRHLSLLCLSFQNVLCSLSL